MCIAPVQVLLAHILPPSSLSRSPAGTITVTSRPKFAQLAIVSGYTPPEDDITFDFTGPSVATGGWLAYTNVVFLPASAARFLGEWSSCITAGYLSQGGSCAF
jgi:hypothetical protein